MEYAVELRGASRHFGEVRAVDAIDLQIEEGTFFAMLGPSGSGKTTCLRLIAGFERPDEGEVCIFGESSAAIPPYRRPVNTVFQDYALFPHLNVRDNVAFGPMIDGVSRAERYRLADEALDMVALPNMASRRPSELSGGQRQRVALARALVKRPKVLLLDEPLGALDLKLREQMQSELKHLQQQLGITFIFVTHDQGEALSMADQVAIFDQGRIQQIGSPESVYSRPETPFVADFVGSSNVLSPDLVERLINQRISASLRPESIRMTSVQDGHSATVIDHAFLGGTTRVALEFEGQPINALVARGEPLPAPGSQVGLIWDESDLHLMGKRGG